MLPLLFVKRFLLVLKSAEHKTTSGLCKPSAASDWAHWKSMVQLCNFWHTVRPAASLAIGHSRHSAFGFQPLNTLSSARSPVWIWIYLRNWNFLASNFQCPTCIWAYRSFNSSSSASNGFGNLSANSVEQRHNLRKHCTKYCALSIQAQPVWQRVGLLRNETKPQKAMHIHAGRRLRPRLRTCSSICLQASYKLQGWLC